MSHLDLTNANIEKVAPSQSLMQVLNQFVKAVDTMDDTVMIPCKLRDVPIHDTAALPGNVSPTLSNGSKALVPLTNGHNGGAPQDLFGFYTMLNAIKAELVRGHSVEDPAEEEPQTQDEENGKQTTALVRHHLRGLFTVLRQMTDTANLLTKRYQDELIGEVSKSTFSV